MSLSNVSLTTAIKNQFHYKLKAYIGVFSSFVILQVFALLITMSSSGGGYFSGDGIEISYSAYSSINIFMLTIIWAFIQSIIMSSKTSWEKNFPFVGNHISHDVSNFIFLLFMSMIAGILTVLSDFLLRVIIYYFFINENIYFYHSALTGQELLSGLTTISLYLILFCAIGYLLGTITRLHRMMPVLLPAIIVGVFISTAQTQSNLFMQILEFYYREGNTAVFIFKIIVPVLLLFFTSVLISSRVEVRK